jgi:hypothetical protein
MTIARALRAPTVIIGLFLSLPAAAEPASLGAAPRDRAESESTRASGATAAAAADAGLLLPSVMAPSVFSGSAFASARSGYDGASEAFVARAVAEGSITRSLALRVDFEHGPSMGPENRLRFGGRLRLLDEESNGIDGAVALFYDANEFREEGNIVGGVLLGKRLGRMGLFVNALFGSDPEGDDQVLEVRLAPLYRVSDELQIGVDTRGRYNMSSDEKRSGTLTRDWELHALPTASYALGPFALVAEAGLSAQRTTGPFGEPDEVSKTNAGVLAMAGAAGAF